MNEYFQSEKVVIVGLHSKMVEAFSELLLIYMKPQAVKGCDLSNVQPDNDQLFLPLPQMYLGVDVMRKLQEKDIQADPNNVKNFLFRARSFAITLCKQLQKRYDFSENNIVSKLAWFSPKCALTYNTQRPMTIASLVDSLPCLVPRKEMQKIQNIDDQCRSFHSHFLQ